MKIYIASKAIHRTKWRHLREAGAPFISRWINVPDNTPDEDINFTKLWQECIEDLHECDILVAVVRPEERLKGVIFEVALALALKKSVFILGDPGRDNGTWYKAPGIEWLPFTDIEYFLTRMTDNG